LKHSQGHQNLNKDIEQTGVLQEFNHLFLR